MGWGREAGYTHVLITSKKRDLGWAWDILAVSIFGKRIIGKKKGVILNYEFFEHLSTEGREVM